MFNTVKPFIKWVGGKSQLLDKIREKYPSEIVKYCEPFVGGGAVLLDVLENFHPSEVLINDINPELCNVYTCVRDSIEELVAMLSEMQKNFEELDTDERKIYYYEKRARFNELIQQNCDSVEKAALFIFINKTCFNGLYRVNGKGLYNVPMGSYKKPSICDTEHLRYVNELLQGIQVHCGEYSECLDFIDSNTFVYIDPPYRPLTETASFTSYAKGDFSDKDQIALGRFIDEITGKGSKVVASNSDPKNSNSEDDFFDELYQRYDIKRVSATRMINSKGNGRGAIQELLICNW